jgi:hypothetical protein
MTARGYEQRHAVRDPSPEPAHPSLPALPAPRRAVLPLVPALSLPIPRWQPRGFGGRGSGAPAPSSRVVESQIPWAALRRRRGNDSRKKAIQKWEITTFFK